MTSRPIRTRILRSVKLSLRIREIDCLEYAASANPPILHRMAAFLTSDHPLHTKFARLREQEEKRGLLDDDRHEGRLAGTVERWGVWTAWASAGWPPRNSRLLAAVCPTAASCGTSPTRGEERVGTDRC